MASSSLTPDDIEEDTVVLECTDLQDEEGESIQSSSSEITISTAEISDWDLSKISSHQIVKVKASRNKLLEQCSYFRGLLSGSFSESSKQCVVIRWNLSLFLEVLRFIHGSNVEITLGNFLPLLQAALYFGVDTLLLECKTWFSDNFSHTASRQIHLDALLLIWNYGFEYGIDVFSGLCTSYMARNFMWAMACESFIDVPYSLLISCIKHPDLTVNCEWHLAEALLSWISAHIEEPKHDNSKFDWVDILKQIRVYILPLWFLMGKRRCRYFSEFAVQSIDVIFSQLERSTFVSVDMQGISDLSSWRIRLTEFTKNLDLSGCPQTNAANLLFSLLPCSWNSGPREGLMPTNIDLKSLSLDMNPISQGLLHTLSLKSVVEVDISKCPKLHLTAVLMLLSKSFPSLRTLNAAYLLDFKTSSLQKLAENFPSLSEVDLATDIGPIIPSRVSIIYSELERVGTPRMFLGSARSPFRPSLSVMTKLTLRGRTDINDSDLHGISDYFVSLCYLDIKGCFSVTDAGISNFISRCARLDSFIACDTLFGKHSTLALCNRLPKSAGFSEAQVGIEYAGFSSINLQLLHIGGCSGVDEASLLGILSQAHKLTSLCLMDTCLVDDALLNFTGSSLKTLNVCNTMISGAALIYIISRNPHLKCLMASGCKGLSIQNKAGDFLPSQWCKELSTELGKSCNLEQFATGWGFSLFTLDTLAPAIRSLKSLTVGLGGSLGEEGLVQLTRLCPKLEKITLLFQQVSDYAAIKLMETLRNLRTLEFCYCMGDLSPQCFKFSVPSLKKLKLERVTPWMTNQDLTLLTQNFPNLTKISLIGCRCLDADSQQIISYGWPGLISLCLEDCGGVTSRGACCLFTCKALEKLLLRHNGPGIKKNFILDAASNLPMLRNISLDWCDANEGDFDLPLFANRCYLSSVKISRCKFQNCTLGLQHLDIQRRAVHKETLVLVWDSTSLQRTVVKERIS